MRGSFFSFVRKCIFVCLVSIALSSLFLTTFQPSLLTTSQPPRLVQLRGFLLQHPHEPSETNTTKKSAVDVLKQGDIFLSIIILTYNNAPLVNRTLSTLLRPASGKLNSSVLEKPHRLPWRWEVLLVDNGCFPSTRDVFKQFTDLTTTTSETLSTVRYIPLCNNTRYSSANNLAANQYTAPSAKWLLFLNDDVVPQEGQGFLWNFHALLSAHARPSSFSKSTDGRGKRVPGSVGAVGCKLLFENQRIVEAGSTILASGKTDNYLRCVHIFGITILLIECFRHLDVNTMWVVV